MESEQTFRLKNVIYAKIFKNYANTLRFQTKLKNVSQSENNGRTDIIDDSRSRRSRIISTSEMIDCLRELILDEGRVIVVALTETKISQVYLYT